MTNKMTDNQRDKINQTIHENGRGLCWHIYDNKKSSLCLKCRGQETFWDEDREKNRNPDYTSDWSAWGAALEWAKEKEWWEKFAYDGNDIFPFHEELLNPEQGSTALAKFIDKNPTGFFIKLRRRKRDEHTL